MKLRPFIPLALFLVVIGLAAAPLLEGKDPARLPSAFINKQAPDVTLAAVTGGKSFSTAEIKKLKKPVIVNFFASYCIPCRAEQKVLELLVKETKVTLYGVDYKDEKDAVRHWLAKNGNPFTTVGFDGDGRAAIDWGVYGVPETFVIDKDGIIRHKVVGVLTLETYQAEIKPLLEALQK